MPTENALTDNTFAIDYLFLGLGAANSLLLVQMHRQHLLENKKIAIIDPDHTALIKKTYCFWGTQTEIKELGLDDAITNAWENLIVNDKQSEPITPLQYAHIPGSSVFELAQMMLKHYDINIITEPYKGFPEKKADKFIFTLENQVLLADTVFDSRPPQFASPQKNQSHLWQSFIGWKIKSTETSFDASTAILMDFEIDQTGTCQFIYLLPFSSHHALVELTRFSKTTITEKEAHTILTEYLPKKNIDYRILDIEKGVIPMSTCSINNPFEDEDWIYTGARGGMLKPSTGYAFKSMAQEALAITSSLHQEKKYHRKPKKKRFLFYDRLLLKILEERPEKGKRIFQSLFNHISIHNVLRFLDEQTSIQEEADIFSKLPINLFLKAAIKDIWYSRKQVSPPLLALIFSLSSLLLIKLDFVSIVWGILATVFLSFGLSHGAIDHLTEKKITTPKALLQFVATYIGKGILFALLWWVTPTIALIGFILFSAWHFGQADYTAWRIKNRFDTLLWGLCVLLLILVFHFQETVYVLNQIPHLLILQSSSASNSSLLYFSQYATILLGFVLAYKHRSIPMLITISYLLITSKLPLMISFGIYFCFQHSLHGWKFLQENLSMKSAALFKKSGPFTLGAILLFAMMAFFYSNQFFGFFFIVLSCMSIPHIFSMHIFYRKSYSGY